MVSGVIVYGTKMVTVEEPRTFLMVQHSRLAVNCAHRTNLHFQLPMLSNTGFLQQL